MILKDPRTNGCARTGEQGIALVLGIFFTVIVVGLTVSGAFVLKSHQTKTRTNYVLHGQALQFARSGLNEAVSWLRRQTVQPVTAFEPQRDEESATRTLDTIDPDIGLVREFCISGEIWGRYEVWKQWDEDPDPARAAWREVMRSEDVSALRNSDGAGTAWKLRSIGYVFRKQDASRPFNVLPNQVLGQEVLDVEALRMTLTTPGQAALNVGDGNSAHVNTNGRISGGSSAAGIYFPAGSGTPNVGPQVLRVSGTPQLATSNAYDDSFEAVFNGSYSDVRASADLVVTSQNEFPVPVRDGDIVVAEGSNWHFDEARPLAGSGLVVFRGNVVLSPGSNSDFRGLLYVDGNLTVRGPAVIRGSVICTGNVTVQGAQGSNPQYAEIIYDDSALADVRNRLGNYRIASTINRPMLGDR